MALEERRLPHRELADGVLILVGGTLMLTPGFVSDIFGILCILPFTRPIGRRPSWRARSAGAWLGVTTTGRWAPAPRTQRRPGPDDGVVQGEVVD